MVGARLSGGRVGDVGEASNVVRDVCDVVRSLSFRELLQVLELVTHRLGLFGVQPGVSEGMIETGPVRSDRGRDAAVRAAGAGDGGADPKSGDWRCGCVDYCWASTVQCRRCKKFRCDTLSVYGSLAGDWYCPCGNFVFERRQSCPKCKIHSRHQAEQVVSAAQAS